MEHFKLHWKLYIAVVAVVLVIGISLLYVKVPTIQVQKTLSEALLTFDAGNLDATIEQLLALQSQNLSASDRVQVNIALASAYTQKGSLSFQEKVYAEKAIQVLSTIGDPLMTSEAFRIMAYAYEISEQYEKAIEYYKRANALDPNNSDVLSGLGHTYDLMGDVDTAADLYTQALQIEPSSDHALVNLARAEYRRDNLESAVGYATRLISTSNNTRFIAEMQSLIGLTKLRQNLFTEADAWLQKAITTDVTMAQNYVALAKSKRLQMPIFGMSEEDRDKVVAEITQLLDTAMSYNPRLTMIYVERAEMSLIIGQYAEVVRLLEQAQQKINTDITLGAQERRLVGDFITNMLLNYKR